MGLHNCNLIVFLALIAKYIFEIASVHCKHILRKIDAFSLSSSSYTLLENSQIFLLKKYKFMFDRTLRTPFITKDDVTFRKLIFVVTAIF